MNRQSILAAMLLAVLPAVQVPAQDTPDSLVVAAKRAAGRDYAGTFLRICVAPDNLTPRAPPPANAARVVPDGSTWYAKPYKVFDNLYFIGTLITEFDGAYDKARIAQLPRVAGEKHPYESDVPTVQRYFEMTGSCAESQRLSVP